MNSVKCKNCHNYDPILSGKSKIPSHGWCIVKSVYPYKEGPGQSFPPGVQRVSSPEKPARPAIVLGDGVVVSCTLVNPKKEAAHDHPRHANSGR